MKEIKRNDMNEMTCCKDATKIVQERKESECSMATMETSVMDGGPCPS